jgi:hypothetical protein
MTNESAYEGRDLEAMAVLSRYYAWIMEEFEPHLSGDAMELGAGQGTIAERLINFVDTLDLVEPSSNLFDQLCEKFGEDEKVTLFNTLSKRNWRLARRRARTRLLWSTCWSISRMTARP